MTKKEKVIRKFEWWRSRPLDYEVRGSNSGQGRHLKWDLHRSGGEGVSPMQGEARKALRRRYIYNLNTYTILAYII